MIAQVEETKDFVELLASLKIFMQNMNEQLLAFKYNVLFLAWHAEIY